MAENNGGQNHGGNQGQNNSKEGKNNSKEGKNNSKEGNKSNPNGVIVLGVYLHCEGCVDSVISCLRGFDGVELVEPDMAKHKVTVKGKNADPVKVTERLRKKSGKHVDLISPIPPKQQEKKEEKKPPQPKVNEVLLKVYLHCEGCAKDVKASLHKMEGVQTVEPDMEKSLVKVKGTFEPNKLVEFVNERLGKNAQILKVMPTKNNDEKKDEKKEGNGSKKELIAYPKYPMELVYAPQLFSDENPNACLIM